MLKLLSFQFFFNLKKKLLSFESSCSFFSQKIYIFNPGKSVIYWRKHEITCEMNCQRGIVTMASRSLPTATKRVQTPSPSGITTPCDGELGEATGLSLTYFEFVRDLTQVYLTVSTLSLDRKIGWLGGHFLPIN